MLKEIFSAYMRVVKVDKDEQAGNRVALRMPAKCYRCQRRREGERGNNSANEKGNE